MHGGTLVELRGEDGARAALAVVAAAVRTDGSDLSGALPVTCAFGGVVVRATVDALAASLRCTTPPAAQRCGRSRAEAAGCTSSAAGVEQCTADDTPAA